MSRQPRRARVMRGAFSAVALTTVALAATACSPAADVAAKPTVVNTTSASPSSTPPPVAATSTPVPTVAAPSPTKRPEPKPKPKTKKPSKPKAEKPKAPNPKPVAVVTPAKPKPTPTETAKPAPPVVVVLRPGDDNADVRSLQARLRQINWFSGDVVDRYGPKTTAAVRGFQGKRGLPQTGVLDQTTWQRLLAMTHRPTSDELNNVKPKPPKATNPPPTSTGLVWDKDERCMTGRVMCVSKSARMLTWVVDGKAQYQFSVRFGSESLATREGTFPVYRKAKLIISNVDGSKMPFSMFFSGGQAVHYSANFARIGYSGNSHGCVNVRDWNALSRLYSEVNLGDKVVIHW